MVNPPQPPPDQNGQPRTRVLRVRNVPVEVVPQDQGLQERDEDQVSLPDPAGPQSRHVELRRLVVRSLQHNEPLDTHEESWERHGSSFLTTETRTRVLTASNTLVEPRLIRGLCHECQRADHTLFICARTGVLLCRSCVCFYDHPQGPIPVSQESLPYVRKALNAWELYDFARGEGNRAALVNVFPHLDRALPNQDSS